MAGALEFHATQDDLGEHVSGREINHLAHGGTRDNSKGVVKLISVRNPLGRVGGNRRPEWPMPSMNLPLLGLPYGLTT